MVAAAMKQFCIKFMLLLLTFGLATPMYSATSKENYTYFKNLKLLGNTTPEYHFYQAIKQFHQLLNKFRKNSKKDVFKKMKAQFKLMQEIAQSFSSTDDDTTSYNAATELLQYASRKLRHPKKRSSPQKESEEIEEEVTRARKKTTHRKKAAPSTSKASRHKKRTSSAHSSHKPSSPVASTSRGSVSRLDTSRALRFSEIEDTKFKPTYVKTPRRKEHFLSPSNSHSLANSSKSHTSSSSSASSKSHHKKFKIYYVKVTNQNGDDCAYHAAKTTKLLADQLEGSDEFNHRDYTSPSAQTIAALKQEFPSTGGDALDGEQTKNLLIHLFEEGDPEAGFFLHDAESYICAQVDYEATVMAQMAVIVKGTKLVAKMQHAKMTAEDGVSLLASESSSLNASGHLEIDPRASRTYRKSGFTLHSKDIKTLLEYHAFLRDSANSPLLPLAQSFAANKCLLLVWQRHSGVFGHTGHWITILINNHNIYVFDSLNSAKLPSGFTTFLKHLPEIPRERTRNKHTEYLATIFG